MPTQSERTEATRAALIAAGRKLFGARGYAGVGTEEVVAEAGVTRGALYHHFRDKRDLFRAVFEDLEAQIITDTAKHLEGVPDAVAALKAGCRGWLEACLRPEVERIVLTDAPAVLGWEEWRAIGERYGLGVVMAMLQESIDQGLLVEQPVRPLAHAVVGMLDEIALYVVRADDREVALAEAIGILDRLVDSMAA